MVKRIPIIAVCPGRGTYTKMELGYLRKYRPQIDPLIDPIDQYLASHDQPTVSELDEAERFSLKTHTPGEYASTLIYACSAADFLNIDESKYEVVAITGNSMGWYTALALSGALKSGAAAHLIYTMGSMMRDNVIGGQLIYPVVNDLWQKDIDKLRLIKQKVAEANALKDSFVQLSIKFGGYAILGGNEKALKYLKAELPPIDDRYPFVLVNHAAFHTALMHETSQKAFAALPLELFSAPQIPIIDGRGKIWGPHSTDLAELRNYTLGHQVLETYDFTKAITTGLKEFAPEKLALLGPGSTSGGAIGQIMIEANWQGLRTKQDFQNLQTNNMFLVSMGREDQNGILRK